MTTIATMELLFVVAAVAAAVCFVLATVYDIKHGFLLSRQAARKTDGKAADFDLTVLVHGVDSAALAQACVRNLRAAGYSQAGIVLVMGRQVPRSVVAQTRRFAKKTSSEITVYAPRTKLKPYETRQRAYQKSRRSDYVLCLSARQAAAVQWGAASLQGLGELSRTRAVVFAESIAIPASFTELAAVFLQLSCTVAYKSLACVGLLRVRSDRAAFYSRETFKKTVESERLPRAAYDSRLVVPGEPHQHADSTRLAGAVAMAVLVVYALSSGILAATFVDTRLFLSGWVAVAVWFAVAIWSNETLTLGRRLVLSVTLPVSYLVVVASAAVVGVSRTVAGKQIT